MLNTQQRGGPDHTGMMSFEDITLGHNLLSIIGHCEQPIENEHYAMVFNGCWYDYKDYYPYSSDTEALLRHFTKRGIRAVDDINGMFAIGLYDKHSKEIHLFVDRFGQKPLFYIEEPFAFASMPSALYQYLEMEIDEQGLNSYWLLGAPMMGMIKGVKKLGASEHLTYNLLTNSVKIERYYEPKERHENIEDLVYDAIDKVKIADVPVNIFLSGGVDSTLVASRFKGYGAIHLNSPELEYAKQVSEKFDIDLHVVFPRQIDVEQVLTDYSKFSGEPTMAGMIPYVVSREARKYCKVAITANGADELFFGYDRTHDIVQDMQIKHILRDITRNINVGAHSEFGSNLFHGRMLELGSYVQHDLNKTLDFASMAHGLEVRSPFLDHRLVEAALTIPERHHRAKGNKTILKNMLLNLGFSNQFVDRQKLGFSLFSQPEGMDEKIKTAWYWCQSEGFLKIDEKKLSGRDKKYLEMSALGFYYWYKTWFV